MFVINIYMAVPKRSDIEHNIDANSKTFGDTKVKSMPLHWNQYDKLNGL